MQKKFRSYLTLQISCFILIANAGVRVCGQERGGMTLDQVPEPSRAQLVKALHQYVEYEKAGQYEQVFEMLYQVSDKHMTSAEYAASRQKAAQRSGVVEDFIPASVINLTLREGDVQTYSINGVAKIRLRRKTSQKEMTLSAWFQNGEWKFSELMYSYLHVNKASERASTGSLHSN